MPEIEITRKQIMVVDKVGTEKSQYGERLTWTDKEGKSYKVKQERKEYFEAVFPGQAVEISFAKYKGKEYPYSADKVADKLPQKVSSDEQFEKLKQEQEGKSQPGLLSTEMTKSDWEAKDRITRKSIERQTALNNAVAVAGIKGLDDAPRIIATAKLFEAYLEGNALVEEAKRLLS